MNQPAITHHDPRLHPQVPMPQLRGWPFAPAYRVTPQAFPALHAQFTALAQHVGAEDFSLVFVDAKPHRMAPAMVDFKRKEIAINLLPLRGYDYDSVLTALIGHELGHIWRRRHPAMPPLTMRIRDVKPGQRNEVEADLVGTCLTGDTTAGASGIRLLNIITPVGETKRYPLPELRALAVEAMAAEDCPLVPVTPARRAVENGIQASAPAK